MSFSSEVKEELARQTGTARHCQIAEIAAILTMCGQVRTGKTGKSIYLHTENLYVARKYFTLLEKTFSINTETLVRRGMCLKKNRFYTLAVRRPEDVKRVLQAVKLESFLKEAAQEGRTRVNLGEEDYLVNHLLVQSSCCKRAFIRGCFLTGGSISNPEKSYHLEIVFSNREKAEKLRELLEAFQIDAKIIARKKYFVLYLKEGRQIVELLNVMEAPVSLMRLENVRILKEISGSVNRQVNCETANISKTVSAAVGQIADIELIRDTIGLQGLPERLEEVARARLAAPEAALKELGNSLSPPIGKSGVNHRLRKLKALADSIRENEEE